MMGRPKKEETNNQELLEKLKEQAEQQKIILAELEELKKKAQQPTTFSYMPPQEERKFGSGTRRELPPDDRLDKPVTFLMRGRGFILSVYQKDGTEVYTPYNRPIRFSHTSSDVRRSGSSDDTMHFSSYMTWSKKEVEYVKESPYFNTLIFDSVTKAMKVNPMIQSAMQQATNHVQTMQDDEVFNHAVAYGIDMRMNVSKIREQLVAIKLQEILEQEEFYSEQIKTRLSNNQ
jgi:hypothetical protein